MQSFVLKTALVLSLLLAPALFNNYAESQFMYAVFGVVTASDTEEPLIGATVTHTASSLGTITDEDGCYRLVGNFSGQIIQYSYPGYKTKLVCVPTAYYHADVQLDPDID